MCMHPEIDLYCKSSLRGRISYTVLWLAQAEAWEEKKKERQKGTWMGQTDKSSTLGMRRSDGRESQRSQLRDETHRMRVRVMANRATKGEDPLRGKEEGEENAGQTCTFGLNDIYIGSKWGYGDELWLQIVEFSSFSFLLSLDLQCGAFPQRTGSLLLVVKELCPLVRAPQHCLVLTAVTINPSTISVKNIKHDCNK